MISTAQLYCITRLRGMQVAYGHAMSCAPTFLGGKREKFGRVLIAPATLHIQDQSVPIARGGPPAYRK